MVKLPRGPLLFFLAGLIALCNTTPFQAEDQNRFRTLDSVKTKLTAFQDFIRKSRTTCRPCGQCSDKNNASAGPTKGQEEQVDRAQVVPVKENTSRDVSQNKNTSHIPDMDARECDCQDQDVDHDVDHDGDANPEPYVKPETDTDQKEREYKQEPGSDGDHVGMDDYAKANTVKAPKKARAQQSIFAYLVPTNRQEKCLHKEHSSMKKNVNLGNVLVANQPGTLQNPAEDSVPSSQHESQTQAVYGNMVRGHNLTEAVIQSEEEATLPNRVSQGNIVEQKSRNHDANTTGDVQSCMMKGCVKHDCDCEEDGSQTDDDLDTDTEYIMAGGVIRPDKQAIVQRRRPARPRYGYSDLWDPVDFEWGSDYTGESDDSPDTAMSEVLGIWRDGPRRPNSNREVRVSILNAEIASDIKLLNNRQLKQCLEGEVRNERAQIDRCKILPSGEIRIWTTDDKGAQILRQVYGWMPGAFGGLLIQRKNSTVVVPEI